ncbi:MAG: hypothetical protein FWD68_07530 [Alphaproteobacteria bacterium]|nr:hypothetical protein [Alphaproteobacteria bacterium]
MYRLFMIVLAAAGLAGCSSLDFFKSSPPNIQLQLDSNPPGADARTSLGPSCKTPCSVTVATGEPFSVSYTMDKYQPATVQVNVTKNGGDLFTSATAIADPNPVRADLQPMTPPKPARRPHARAKGPKAASAFPDSGAPND